jgi:putative Mn2+ efflux pump MntP
MIFAGNLKRTQREDILISMHYLSQINKLGKSSYLFYGSLSLALIGLTGMLSLTQNAYIFHPFLGSFNPILAIFLLSMLGFPLSQKGFSTYRDGRKEKRELRVIPFGSIILFAAIAIVIDIIARLPKNMNIPFPQSLAFYPVIGFVVEILFHIVPLFLFSFILSFFFKNDRQFRLIWPCLIAVSFLEPIYQIMAAIGELPGWALGAIGINVWGINIMQLMIFKRYGFISMYAFRLVYYLAWHIIWGYLRLHILF